MKLSISNIAWPAEQDGAVYAALREVGVTALELAPTRIWPDWQFGAADVRACREALARQGLGCSSLQAVLFNRPELQLFGTPAQRAELRAHLERVADLAAELGAGPMVFGAPKNRDRGTLGEATAFELAAEFFARIGAYCAERGVCLCLEPNPVTYGCNFVTDSRRGAELVRAVGSSGFRLHLDAAGMHLAEENTENAVRDCADVLAHVHVSEPFLGHFGAPEVDHAGFARGLRAIGWEGWVAIEMRASNESLVRVQEAVAWVAAVYA